MKGSFSPAVIIGAILISAMSFAGFLVLSAYAPDLQSQSRAGPHPYSKSARGYATFIELLDRAGQPSLVTRSLEDLINEREEGLLVFTPAGPQHANALEEVSFEDYGRKLLVLPKWGGYAAYARPSWDAVTHELHANDVTRVLEALPLWEDFDMPELVRRETEGPASDGLKNWPLELADDVQLLRGGDLIPILTVGDDILLGRVPEREFYILSDPDMFCTHGLKSFAHVELAVNMVERINPYEGPIIWDATLHGFKRSNNLIQLAVEPPFLGATIAALALIGVIGWGASVRFGHPLKTGRVYALGKETLADNTAALITLTGREKMLAPEYLDLTRRLVRDDLGLPASYDDYQLTQVLDRVSREVGAKDTWSKLDELSTLYATVTDRDGLRQFAARLFAWREEVTRDRN